MPDLSQRIRDYVESAESPVTIYEVGAVIDRHAGAAKSRDSRGRSRWRPVPIFLGVGVAALVSILVLQFVPTSGQMPTSAAAETLARFAAVSAQQSGNVPGPGQYLYYRTTRGLEGISGGIAGSQSFPLLSTETIDTWVASNGSGRQRIDVGQPTLLLPAEQSAWEAAGSPSTGTQVSGVTDTLFPSNSHIGGPLVSGANGQYKLAYIDSSQFPSDPHALQQYLNHYFDITGGALTTFLLAGDLLQVGASPTLRTALFNLIEQLPGIELVGPTSDASGRSGTGIALNDGKSHRYVLVVDPQTSAVLGEKILMGPVAGQNGVPIPQGTVLGFATFGTSAIVSSTDVVPSKAASSHASGSSPTAPPSATYTGPISAPIKYQNAGITLEPPGSSVQPKASWSDAYTKGCSSGDAICSTSSGPTISLALATSPQAGQANTDGSINPLMNKTLVYVITWTGVTCVRAGGPPEPPGAAVAIDSCTLLNFIDANSGTVLYSVSGPNP